MLERARPAIVAFGAYTSSGLDATGAAAAARAGVIRFELRTDARVAGPHAFTVAPALRGDMPLDERLFALARPALDEALHDLGDLGGRAVDLLLAVPAPRPGPPAAAARALRDRLAAHLAERGACADVDLVPAGHAAGLAALHEAWRRIAAGVRAWCVVGGVDSYLARDTLSALHEEGQLKSERNRWGFVAGEAAGFCVLGAPEFVTSRRLRARAEVLAAGTGREEVVPRGHVPILGVGLGAALRGALGGLPTGAQVAEVVCDINGERWRGDEYGFALPRIARSLEAPGRFVTPASAWGDVGAASGPLFALAAVHAGERGYAAGRRALLWASSDSGERAAVLLDVPVQERA